MRLRGRWRSGRGLQSGCVSGTLCVVGAAASVTRLSEVLIQKETESGWFERDACLGRGCSETLSVRRTCSTPSCSSAHFIVLVALDACRLCFISTEMI
ncbi:hypothetical protein BD779DRAFT_1590557 [Infundibulicybe gibba]|nr:hypothetical protein BD779DRAFT_1590557 [Infundibulicybe gibba]